MLYYWLLFFFVAVGAKLILAGIMVYLLLPDDRLCNQCNEETLLLRPGRVGRWSERLLLGRVQRRWCPRCGWDGLARRAPGQPHSDVPLGPTAPTR